MCGFGDQQPLTQAGVGQHEVVRDLAQGQLIPQARFALAQGVHPTPDRRHPLTDVEVEALAKDVLMVQPQAARTCSMASWVPNTTRCFTPTMRRRRYDFTTCA